MKGYIYYFLLLRFKRVAVGNFWQEKPERQSNVWHIFLKLWLRAYVHPMTDCTLTRTGHRDTAGFRARGRADPAPGHGNGTWRHGGK